MDISGIICEYNPFHSGHAAHIAMTRELMGEDGAVVCAMSGNFVQRGEPASVDKHARAEMAVLCGADLVLEIPAVWSCASAERFSMAGVSILDALGLPMKLSFGSECGDISVLERIASVLMSDEASELVRSELNSGISYAAARQRAAEKLMGKEAEALKEPNNILGIEYVKAIMRLNCRSLTPVTFRRVSTSHDGAAEGNMAPASLIREMMARGEDVSHFMPEPAYEILNREITAKRAPAGVYGLETAILYKLMTMEDDEYAALPDSSEGLWMRLKKASAKAKNYKDILTGTKTKRYAMSRVRRMVIASLLGITAEMQESLPPYIRVLALNDRGRKVLHDAGITAKLPIITKPASAKKLDGYALKVFMTEARATDIYALACPDDSCRGMCREWTTGPVILP